jgi:hypothetical protein
MPTRDNEAEVPEGSDVELNEADAFARASEANAEQDLDTLKKARASWETNTIPSPTYKTPQQQAPQWPHTFSNKTDYQAPFPEAVSEESITEQPQVLENLYSFEMFDASDEHGNKVLIIDGLVFGVENTEGVLPSGMGDDDFTILVNEGDEVWLVIGINTDENLVTSASIDSGPVTPDDLDDGSVIYVTIGSFTIDPDSGATIVENSLCGDYFVPRKLDVIDEEGNITSDVTSITFTTEGDDFIDVVVTDDGFGAVTVIYRSSQDLKDMQQKIDDLNKAVDDLKQQFQDLKNSVQEC